MGGKAQTNARSEHKDDGVPASKNMINMRIEEHHPAHQSPEFHSFTDGDQDDYQQTEE